MADNCISVYFEEGDYIWDYCWEDTTPEPTWAATNLITGLRKGQGAEARAWRTCHYYLKGFPAICRYWTESDGGWSCSFNTSNDFPTGYNHGVCDNLGRRSWCDKYEALGTANLDEWICAAPNGYLTGLGKRAEGLESPIVQLLNRSDIAGYNDDGNGVGRCDCHGYGRGSAGCSINAFESVDVSEADAEENEDASTDLNNTAEQRLLELPVVCNYYRPWSMGFGAVTPRPKETIEEARIGIDAPIEIRLPLSIELINNRARFQKCNYWEEDYSSDFVVYDNSIIILEDQLTGSPFDGAGRIEMCKCDDTDADGYNHRLPGPASPTFMTGLVSAVAGGLICNGARPECPCYSGKWMHCTQDKMSVGMPVTANQILELRFWASDWETKKQYDKFFDLKQNFDDARNTSDIYTFTKWDRRSKINAVENRMIGKRLNLCFPIVGENKEFTEKSIFVESPIEYAPIAVEIGTVTKQQRHFPTLLRNQDFIEVKTFAISYPPHSDGGATIQCDDEGDTRYFDDAGHIKRSNNIYGDSVTTIGWGIRNKTVYAINTEEFPVSNYLKNQTTMLNVPPDKQDFVTFELIKTAYTGILSGSEYFVQGTCDSIFGVYILPPIKLKYNQENEILIMIDFGDGTWGFGWRIVNSKWCGGLITQTSYDHTYIGDDYNNDQPLGLDPKASAEFKMEELSNCTPAEVLPVYSLSVESIFNDVRYYSYSIIEKEETATQISSEDGTQPDPAEIRWWPLGNSNMINVFIEDLELNYIYNWDLISAKLTPTPEKIKELEKMGRPTDPIPMEQFKYNPNDDTTALDRHALPPNFKLLRPVDSNKNRQRFFPGDWYLEVEYKYEKLVNEDPGYDAVVKAGARKTDSDVYIEAPFSLTDYGYLIDVGDISNGPVNLMAYFNDSDGRLISTMATKACLNIVRESCRNIEIFYAYKAEGTVYFLQPEGGFCIDIAADKARPTPFMHGYTPDCGTHYYFPWLSPGPQWFPFDNCRGYDMYDEWTICNNCQTGFAGPMNEGVLYDSNGNIQRAGGIVIKRKDYRYCGPFKYHGFGTPRPTNAAAACNCGCTFSYSDAATSTVIFAGYSNIEPAIDAPFFLSQGWQLPPFGNHGREIIEKFISNDFIHHYYGSVGETRAEWMPMVMDHSMFFMSFNAYDSNPEDTLFVSDRSGIDPFYYTNQMNFFTLYNINERIDLTSQTEGGPPPTDIRYRFDDLFEIHHEAICTYPRPAYSIVGGKTKVIFYYLKPQIGSTSGGSTYQKDITWVWQEFWRDIERNLSWTLDQAVKVVADTTTGLSEDEIKAAANKLLINSGHLDFVRNINKPEYVFSYYKEENRLITEEGDHYIDYTAPILDEKGNIVVHATISIDGGFPRTFEIIYGDTVTVSGVEYVQYNSDNYNNEQVRWLDEGGKANVDGSSKKDNIYERTRGEEWIHHSDAIFSEADFTTSAAETSGRAVVKSVGESNQENKKYYNRGLIIDMPKSRLDYLPKVEKTYVYGGAGIFQESGDGDGILTMQVSEEYEPNLEKDEPFVFGNHVWETTATFSYASDPEDPTAGINLYKLRITGLWGLDTKVVSVRPSISITATYQDGSVGIPRMFNSLPSDFRYGTSEDGLDTYAIETQFLLSPVEMLRNRMTGFTISLEGSGDELTFLSIQDIDITTVEYLERKIEPIKVWERRYLASTYEKGPHDINLDASDNLYRDTDSYNAGLYFPVKGAGNRSRPEEEVSGLNKTKAIYTGLLYQTSEDVEITYDNLHSVEEYEQKRLYEYATERDDAGDTMTYKGITPYKIDRFLKDLKNVKCNIKDAVFVSQTLQWEKHKLYKRFKQYEYWRPGGHFYRWSGTFRNERCMLFGGTHDVFDAEYVHVDHKGIGTPLSSDASKPTDLLNVYGSQKHYVQLAKYDRAMILAGGSPEYTDKWTSTSVYNPLTRVRIVSGDIAPDQDRDEL